MSEPEIANTVVALRAPGPTLDITAYEPKSVAEARSVAELISRSGMLGKIPARPETVFFLLARGRELGFTMAQSLDAFHILDGKPTLTAPAKVALCHRRSDVCRWLRCVESTEEQATWETLRVGHPEPTRHTYTIADARKAGLLNGSGGSWQKRPKLMLRWRAATELINLVYSDLTLGLYTPDEAEEVAAAEGHVIDVEARVPVNVPLPPTEISETTEAPVQTPPVVDAPQPAAPPRAATTEQRIVVKDPETGAIAPCPVCGIKLDAQGREQYVENGGRLEVVIKSNGSKFVGCTRWRDGCRPTIAKADRDRMVAAATAPTTDSVAEAEVFNDQTPIPFEGEHDN